MSNKNELRDLARKLNIEHQAETDNGHVFPIIDSMEFLSARVVAIYLSVSTEPNTSAIIEKAFEKNKRVAIPIFNSQQKIYDWCELTPTTKIIVGKYGIKESESFLSINPLDIDVCYVPGLLFDKRGVRLGHGGGFYDRLLLKLSSNAKIIGLAFPWQLVEELPAESHDILCHKVITKNS